MTTIFNGEAVLIIALCSFLAGAVGGGYITHKAIRFFQKHG